MHDGYSENEKNQQKSFMQVMVLLVEKNELFPQENETLFDFEMF
jgi:hypothetical protein